MRVYVASVHWNNEEILRSHWNDGILHLAKEVGSENMFLSVFESGSWDGTKSALRDLDRALDALGVARNITMSEKTHHDETSAPPAEHGWIDTPPRAARSYDAYPILPACGTCHYSLSTNQADSRGKLLEWDGLAFITQDLDIEELIATIVSLPASLFYADPPLKFRGVSDSLALAHVEGSECCLIHADNPLTKEKGVYLNPQVRVGYNPTAYSLVHPANRWVLTWQIFLSPTSLKEWVIRRRVQNWEAQDEGKELYEPGQFCLINEMQFIFGHCESPTTS
ncbi:hypothetical protein N7451_012534 [Penicillium sp. IBT 35674x]|nr:hypothetical protein N7451_012534 [Penicillium sp. IBT 35674x]